MSTNKKDKECFVVTPIGEPDSEERRNIDGILEIAIKPVFEDEYNVVAAHTCFESTSITKQVYQKLYESELVIVDLTGLNPNVMYELGIRFCFGKPTILIAKEGTRPPFDINERRTFFYKSDALGKIELRDQLIKIKKSIKLTETDSPIHDALKEVQLFHQEKIGNHDDKITDMLSLMMKKLDTFSDQLTYKTEKMEIRYNNIIASLLNDYAISERFKKKNASNNFIIESSNDFNKKKYDELLREYANECANKKL